MIEAIKELNDPVLQAVYATLFTWFVTTIGASLVFFFKKIGVNVLNGMLGFGSGVMIAASFWSLLSPSISITEELKASGHINLPIWFPALIGFASGGLFLLLVHKLLPDTDIDSTNQNSEKSGWQRSILLFLAITLHNIPEGLAIGVAFGAAAAGVEGATVGAAIALAIGVGLQNFPEGFAVSVPLRKDGLSRVKSFMYGQASGVVEPIAGFLGAILAMTMHTILPYVLSFAAGAMIYVVVEELIPESQIKSNSKIATIGAMIGFALMMTLDVALG